MYFCSTFINQHNRPMDTQNQEIRHYKAYKDYMVEMHTEGENPAHHLVRGRALLNPEESRLTFVENEKRQNRSKEISREERSRLVRRKDGWYTLTFRIAPNTKYLKESLVNEMRTQAEAILTDISDMKKGKEREYVITQNQEQ